MRRGGTVCGAVSLTVIFCTLCMAVFASLTFVTAKRERTLADLTALRAAEFYRADCDATRIAAALRGGDFDGAAAILDGEGAIVRTETDAGTLAEFSLPAGGEQRLNVRLLLRGGDMEILSWKKVYAGQWETDDLIILAEIN